MKKQESNHLRHYEVPEVEVLFLSIEGTIASSTNSLSDFTVNDIYVEEFN